MEPATLPAGYSIENGVQVNHYQEGEIIVNVEEIEAILPSEYDERYGAIGYNNWYMYHIDEAIKYIEEILETTDFENEMIYYLYEW